MKTSHILVRLCWLVVVLTLIAAAAGLFWPAAGMPFAHATVHETNVEIYGRGLYRYDSSFKAPILRGGDAVFLFIGIPVLTLAIQFYRRGSLRGNLLLTGVLACFLYNAASLAFGAAYNPLFLLYVAYFGTSTYAFILAFGSIDLDELSAHSSPHLPHRVIGVFVFIAGLSAGIWLVDIIVALVSGHAAPQNLAHYTTDVTAVLDIGIIAPTSFLAGVLMLRREPLGYLLSSTMLILLALIGMIVAGQTVMQVLDGIALSVGEFAIFVVPFVVLSVVAIGLTGILFRHIQSTTT